MVVDRLLHADVVYGLGGCHYHLARVASPATAGFAPERADLGGDVGASLLALAGKALARAWSRCPGLTVSLGPERRLRIEATYPL